MSQVITVAQCGDLLAMFVSSRSAPEEAKALARHIGYRESTFFGSAGKRLRLMEEVVCIYSAIAIYSVNAGVRSDAVKPVVDAFLKQANAKIFVHIEAKDPSFRATYTARVQEYFGIFSGANPPVGASFALMSHLGLKPLKNLPGQLWLAQKLGEAAKETVEILRGFQFIGLPEPPKVAKPPKDDEWVAATASSFGEFMATMDDWPAEVRIKAMNALTLLLEGKTTEAKTEIMSLPRKYGLPVIAYAKELSKQLN